MTGGLLLADTSAGWAADKIGRKNGVAIGAVFCLLGSALMTGSVNSDMVSTQTLQSATATLRLMEPVVHLCSNRSRHWHRLHQHHHSFLGL